MPEPRAYDAGSRPLYRTPGTPPRPPRRRARPSRRMPRWPGSLPGSRGVAIVIGSAALGGVLTAASGSVPGILLGIFLVAGTLIAALAVRPPAVYLIIPAPALCYVITALITGLLHDQGAGVSRTALAVSAAQWIASGFLAMTAATVLAIVATAVRWPRTRRGRRGPAPF
jgi:hypothetical protein